MPKNYLISFHLGSSWQNNKQHTYSFIQENKLFITYLKLLQDKYFTKNND
jgi:hypothetical protein